MDKIMEIFECMNYHNMGGFGVEMTHWEAKHFDENQYFVEGVLVSVKKCLSYHLFPCGWYECSLCKNKKKWDFQECAYFDDETMTMMCKECKYTLNHIVLQVVTSITNDTQMGKIAGLEVNYLNKDTFMNESHNPQIMHLEAELFADYIGGVFFRNMNIAELRKYLLAKRVIRKMRSLVEKRNRVKVFRILYEKANMGVNAALWFAKKVVIT